MINSFNNTPRYIACPDYDDNDVWRVIDMQKNVLLNTFNSEQEAVDEVRKLNANGLN